MKKKQEEKTGIYHILKKNTSKREKEAFLDKIAKQTIKDQRALLKEAEELS